ncbi:LPS export ABC transporter periplasmic protein LptC [Falsirhodobacter algicola]|uniref:LPS export ABC transporter periplasmic protein LptC n=1 Tax=Falsirhodobacter algicola TaxID=2692330 RepID=A0A8J8MTM7_9RHOB|nr:LPS export ABC transporter periplasmic protein LptC [Falsirhodobacter algicola]QUS36033.1 LPS export ABC transporter periplasmic protein LptC [Falsirhodobacter algicola]
MGRGDRHTRLVALLKIVLPLVALVLLSTIFLVSRTIDPDAAIPYATIDVTGRAMDPRMTAPHWSGVTGDGASLDITAAEARTPTATEPAVATALRAMLKTPDGVTTEIAAARGAVDPAAGRIDLSENARLQNSIGYDVRMPELTTYLDRTEVIGRGPVTAQAPMGQLTAGGMTLTAGADENYRLDFTNGVKLIYTPTR